MFRLKNLVTAKCHEKLAARKQVHRCNFLVFSNIFESEVLKSAMIGIIVQLFKYYNTYRVSQENAERFD